jgi:predicted lipoprotein with Yx(FWY)xxD motif
MNTISKSKVGVGIAAAAVAMVLAGCGSSSSGGSGTNTTGTGSGTGTATLKSASTGIGTVLVAPNGHTVYELVGNTTAHNLCSGGCLAIWPPVMSGGTQVVIHGHPAYTFSGDASSGQTNGQDAKDQWGTWLALTSSGQPIAAGSGSTSTPSSTPSSSGGGGYGY